MRKPEIRIVNLKHSLLKLPTIRVDGQSWLGNPFVIGTDGNRTEVIELYKQWFDDKMLNDKEFKERFYQLAKKYHQYEIIQLACWCYPKMCHASIIKQALEEIYND
jgi:hypothetical protein